MHIILGILGMVLIELAFYYHNQTVAILSKIIPIVYNYSITLNEYLVKFLIGK